ncbi:MAG: trigger factor [Fretibacterium sp.]|nr:trigger factor [Fretibacterium sp.]
MKTELLGQEKNVVKIKVEFEAEEFLDGLKKALSELSQQARIPGFRKGHAPRKILEMRLGRGTIYSEALDKILPENIQKIIEDYELETIDTPSVNVGDIHEGEPVSCELTFEVMPEVELPELENVEVEQLRTVVTDEMVDRLIRRLRKEHSKTNPVERPVGNDDLVDITLVACAVEEGAKPSQPQKSKIDLFDETVRQELRSALAGHSKGETVEAEFDVEPDHQDVQFAGKRLHYTMTIEGVSEYALPELNDEFYKKALGENTDVHTEEAFRDKMRTELHDSMESENRVDAERRAVTKVTLLSKVDVPDTLVDRQVKVLRQRDEDEVHQRYGAELKDVLGQGNEDWEKGYLELQKIRAAGMVRQSLVVEAIGKKYEVNVEKEDVEAELTRRAALFQVDRSRLLNYLYKNENAMSRLIDDVRYGKITSLLLTKIKVKEVDELSPEQPAATEGEGAAQSETPQPVSDGQGEGA